MQDKTNQTTGGSLQSETLLQKIIDTLPQAIYWKDRNLVYLGCNQAFAYIAGLSHPNDSIGKTDADLPWKPEAIVFLQTRDRRVMESQKAERGMLEPLVQADGRQTWLRTSTIPLYDDNGSVMGVLGTFDDITERKQGEDELRIFKALAEAAPDMIGIAHLEGRITYVNESFRTALGIGDSTDTISAEATMADEERERLRTEIIPQIVQHGMWSGTTCYKRMDTGRTFPVQATGFLVRDEAGTPIALANISRDITEQRRTEEELREREQRLQSIFNNSVIGMYRTTSDGRFAMASPAMARILGYDSPEELISMVSNIGQQLYVNPEQRQDIIKRIMQKQEIVQQQVDFWCKDGSIVTTLLTAWGTPGKDGSIIHIEGFMQDIREQIQAEAERAALQQQIIDAQQGTLRELSTPLIPITNTVVIMPLIGTIDSQRAQMVLETLLEGVAQHQAELVILDITGVTLVDTQVAQALISAAQAVKLLGAQVMLTGIQPQIAQTLVHLGVDLRGIATHSSLQAGIAAALRQLAAR